MRLMASLLFASLNFIASWALHHRSLDPAPDQTSEETEHTGWAGVAFDAAKWWLATHSEKSLEAGSAQLTSARGYQSEGDIFQELGVSPLGESTWEEGRVFDANDLHICTFEEFGKYKLLSNVSQIAEPSPLTTLMDVGIYLGNDAASDVTPCRSEFKQTQSGRPFTVVYDHQYTNRPRCCALEYLPDEGSSHIMKALAGTVHVGNFSDFSMTVLTPNNISCTPDRRCPMIVELAGFSGVPWLLLQAWCESCMMELRSVLASVDTHGHSSLSYVIDTFVPAIKQFIPSREDVDSTRVYLVATGEGNEVGLMSALRNPDLFAFSIFSGKFMFTEEIKHLALFTPARPCRLTKMSFHIGSEDNKFNSMQNFIIKLQKVVKPLGLPVSMELHYYPGAMHSTWYAAWNAYHDLLWTGRRDLRSATEHIFATSPSHTSLSNHFADKLDKMLNLPGTID